MEPLKTLIRYFCLNYPYKSELSKARLTKMVYLADWLHSKKFNSQITDIQWVFNHYGPYVDDVVDAAYDDPEVDVLHTSTAFGTPKVIVQAKEGLKNSGIASTHLDVAKEVIESTEKLSFNSFIKFVYDTYPIRVADRYQTLDLINLAQQEQEKP